MLHGSGVVCGLDIKGKKDGQWIEISSGLALDCSGNEIWVPKSQHEENNRDEEEVVSPKLEMNSALEIMPTLHFHKSSDVVQPKCSDESCTEENGKQVDGDTTLQRVPTLNEEEEEKVATKTADTTPESLGSQSNSKDTTTDLPLRRQMREEDEEGVETSQVPIVERQIDAVEQQQAPPRSMHGSSRLVS